MNQVLHGYLAGFGYDGETYCFNCFKDHYFNDRLYNEDEKPSEIPMSAEYDYHVTCFSCGNELNVVVKGLNL